jgi:hypothetical protein
LILSPERPDEPDHPEHNPYHSHIAAPSDWLTEDGNWLMALAIRSHFERDGKIYHADGSVSNPRDGRSAAKALGLLRRIWGLVRDRLVSVR